MLAALRFGAAKAVGTDIDLDALMSAKSNCRMNSLPMDFYLADGGSVAAETYGIADRPMPLTNEEQQSILQNKFRGSASNAEATGTPDAIPSVSRLADDHPELFDLTVANILAPILCSLAPHLAALTKPGGRVALSGLLRQQAGGVMETYAAFFEDVKVVATEDDWALITGIRKD